MSTSTGSPTPTSPAAGIVEKVVGVVSALLGQAPWITTITGTYPISLYQPSIYHGKELFLLVPMMTAVISTWAVMLWRWVMWVIFCVFIILAILIYWMYSSFSVLSPVHPINWVLSYCAFALFVAALARAAVDILK